MLTKTFSTKFLQANSIYKINDFNRTIKSQMYLRTLRFSIIMKICIMGKIAIITELAIKKSSYRTRLKTCTMTSQFNPIYTNKRKT
jgi:hypothetical protein